MNITNFEKKIYNCYLKNYRKGQPYKFRKDFSDLEPNNAAYLQKISYFLNKYNHIDCEEYFDAFNALHPEEKYPPLNYFYSRGALKTYALYKKQQEDRNPEKQFDKIKVLEENYKNECEKLRIYKQSLNETPALYSEAKKNML